MNCSSLKQHIVTTRALDVHNITVPEQKQIPRPAGHAYSPQAAAAENTNDPEAGPDKSNPC